MDHKYDNPALSATGFLFAVMHDPLVSLDDTSASRASLALHRCC